MVRGHTVDTLNAHVHISDSSLVEWGALPSLSQTTEVIILLRILAFSTYVYKNRKADAGRGGGGREREGRGRPRPRRSIRPWWGYGNAQRLRLYPARTSRGPSERRFTLCSCETITVMGWRAEKSWGNARWAVGLRERTTSAIL